MVLVVGVSFSIPADDAEVILDDNTAASGLSVKKQNGDTVLRASGDGNVGIGISAPTEKLDVNGTVKATAFIGDGSSLTGISGGSGNGDGHSLDAADGAPLDVVSVDNAGNVNIGSTASSSNAQINFDIEGNYVQEDAVNGTDFSNGVVLLNNTGGNNTNSLQGVGNLEDVAIGNVLPMATGSALTLECWIKITDFSIYNALIHRHDPATGNSNYKLFMNPGGRLRYLSDPTIDILFNTIPPINTWTHIALVIDPASGKYFLYKNGALVETVTASTGFNNHPNAILRFGAIEGLMDDVRIWNVAKTANEIANNYNNELSGSEPGLIGYWKLNEGSGTTVIDSAGQNNGTITLITWSTDVPFGTGGQVFPTSQAYYVHTDLSSQIDSSTWTNINSVTLSQTTPTNTSIKYLVSFDNRTTWKYWDGTVWTDSSLANLQTDGMDKAFLEGISQAQWNASGGFVAGTTATLDFAADLLTTDSSATPSLDQISVAYSGSGSASGSSIYVDYNSGNVGIGTTVPSEQLYVNGNITATGAITQGSSKVLKKDISDMTTEEALTALYELNPIKYKYKADYSNEEHLGFIAEDVPDIVATKDRKRLSPMDLTAVLTKVVQEQQKQIKELQREISILKSSSPITK